MKLKKVLLSMLVLSVMFALIFSCTEDASTKPNYIFKPAPKQGVVAKVVGVEILEEELSKGIQNEIFEAENKVYEMKMNRLRALVLEKIMNSDPRKKGLTNDQYLDQHIVKGKLPGKKAIMAFIKKRKIPKEHVNAQLKERIRKFLSVEFKKAEVDKWISMKTKKSPIEVYLKKPMRPVFDVQVGDSPFKGGADAKVTIVEFTDFQCPYCSKGAQSMKEVYKKYGSKVKIVFKNFPLPFHKQAKLASEASLCAGEKKKKRFWNMYERIFANQDKIGAKWLRGQAEKTGVKMSDYDLCMKNHKFLKMINMDMGQGKNLGVKATPTFFINGQLVAGALPSEKFIEIIDELLKK